MVNWKPLFPSAEQQNPIQWTACFRHPPVPNLACWPNQLRHFLANLTQTWSIDRGELSFYFTFLELKDKESTQRKILKFALLKFVSILSHLVWEAGLDFCTNWCKPIHHKGDDLKRSLFTNSLFTRDRLWLVLCLAADKFRNFPNRSLWFLFLIGNVFCKSFVCLSIFGEDIVFKTVGPPRTGLGNPLDLSW